jgi:iron-sulfur cluster protein
MTLKSPKVLHRELAARCNEMLKRTEWRNYLRDALTRTLRLRRETISLLFTDFEMFRDDVREVKERAVNRLDEMFEMFKKNCEKRGVRVYLAKDAEEACSIIFRIAVEKNAKLLTKSKSMTTEEIMLNAYLEEKGLKIVETDLGEFIIQLAGEKPFHLVYPSVHKTRYEVAELFSKLAGRELSAEISDLMQFARGYLRELFLSADIGVTGANIAIAETGTVVVETNEGNDRLGSIPPKTHVVVMGMEKIVEKVEDALKLIVAHPVSSTGQFLTTYVSFVSGRNPLAGDALGRELHVVVIDNGRRAMRDDPWFKEALYCIRCGACMNICPTYSAVGGHVFGYIYTGAIGLPWTAYVHGLESAAEFAPLCISCGLCKEICPVKIDIPMLIAGVKHRYVREAGQLMTNRVLENYEAFYSFASRAPWLFNALLRRGFVRALMERLLGIDRRRPIPPVARKTFAKLFNERKWTQHERRAVIFADFFIQFVRPELGIKLCEALNMAGYTPVLPPQKTSGYPYIAYGDLDKAAEVAKYNVRRLSEALGENDVIVSAEPTAVYALKYVYPRLLNNSEDSVKVSKASVSASELLDLLVNDGRLAVKRVDGGKVGIHIPCHERALDESRSVYNLLRHAGYEAVFVETGTCCGMAGSFGMKHGVLGYGLANAVGEPLFNLFKQSGCGFVVTNSSVCRIHIEQGTGLAVYNPLEVLEFTAPNTR